MPQITPEQAFQIAVVHQRDGEHQQAEALYKQILASQPRHAGALHCLGMIAQQAGRNAQAIELIRQSIACKAANPEAWYHLGEALREQGQPDQAIAAFRQALAVKAKFPQASNNLGNLLWAKGEFDEAIAVFQLAISLNPEIAALHGNLSNSLRDLGRLDEAIAASRLAIALDANFPEAYNNLGTALWEKGQLQEAMTACRQAISIRPNFPQAFNNLGNALKGLNRPDEAISAYRRAIALMPQNPEAYNNLATALREVHQLDEAIAACRQAIAQKPNFAEAFNNLANCLEAKRLLVEAIAAARRAITLNPNLAGAWCCLGNLLVATGDLDEAIVVCREAIRLTPQYFEAIGNLGNALKDAGRLDEAIAAYRQAISCNSQSALAHSNLVYTLHFHSDYDSAKLLEENRKWAAIFEAPLAGEIRQHLNNRDPARRLKIGYVSPDFRTHAAACFLLPLLANHNPENVEVYCYASVKRPDAITAKMQQLNVVWRNCIGMFDAEMAAQIRQDQIDILVDLTLHMADNRLLVFARKPAPVQVTWLGYPSTTGLSTIDYRLTDRYIDPVDSDEFYSEKSIRLPNSFWCYQPLVENTPEVNALPAIKNGFITFGCFNNFAKVTPATLRLWMQVLMAIADSRLIIQSHPGRHRDDVIKLFQENGIDPKRIEFVGKALPVDYFRYYHRVDLCLDPIPYPGHTSSLDALWMGVPSVTLAGGTAASRGGASIMSNIGLPEFVARTPEEYVAIAARCDLMRLGQLRASLREKLRSSPLMDAKQFCADLESIYRRMWRAW